MNERHQHNGQEKELEKQISETKYMDLDIKIVLPLW